MEKNNNQNGRIRKKRDKFAQVSNIALTDEKLTLRAKGLYAIIQSYITLSDFIIYKNYLLSICVDGKSSFDRAWDELKENGYLIQYPMKDKAGKIYFEYELLDEPRELSEEEKKAFEQKEANRIARNKRKIEKQKEKKHGEKQPDIELPPMGRTTGGSSTNGSSTNGSSVYINNTDLNNTDLNNTDNTTEQIKTASKDAVVLEKEKLILQETNIKELTLHQKKKILKWDIETLKRSIKIYNRENGLYFKLLEKIYNDGAIESLVAKKEETSKSKFTNIQSHNWDLDEIAKLEREYVQRKLKNNEKITV